VCLGCPLCLRIFCVGCAQECAEPPLKNGCLLRGHRCQTCSRSDSWVLIDLELMFSRGVLFSNGTLMCNWQKWLRSVRIVCAMLLVVSIQCLVGCPATGHMINHTPHGNSELFRRLNVSPTNHVKLYMTRHLVAEQNDISIGILIMPNCKFINVFKASAMEPLLSARKQIWLRSKLLPSL
jgi:hypothetical protein